MGGVTLTSETDTVLVGKEIMLGAIGVELADEDEASEEGGIPGHGRDERRGTGGEGAVEVRPKYAGHAGVGAEEDEGIGVG